MDIISKLPPEINEIIMMFLGADDLWSCLSINRAWRTVANTDRLWLSHWKTIGINICEEDISKNCEFTLCVFALKWKRFNCLIKNWKKKAFKSHNLVGLSRPRFYSRNNNLAIVEDNQDISIFNLRDDSLSYFKISLPTGIHYPEEGNVLMNDNHVIIVCNNIGIIYKKDKLYNLQSIFATGGNQNVEISTSNFLEFLNRYEDFHIVCGFSYLSHNKFWSSYWIDDILKRHVLIDIVTNEITLITPPVDAEVVEVIGINHRIIFEFLYDIIIYDIEGRILFKKCVGEYCCASLNDQVVAVFKSSFIAIYDILTGLRLHQLSNEYYQPRLFVSPCKNIILLNGREGKHDVIIAFDITSGQKLWNFIIPNQYFNFTEITFIDINGSLLVVSITGSSFWSSVFSTIHVFNLDTGFQIYEEYFKDLHFLSPNFLVTDLDPMKLMYI